MAILTPKEAPKKVTRDLDPDVESDINQHLLAGIWEYQVSDAYLLDKKLVIEVLKKASWGAKFEVRETNDPEVQATWIVLNPIV